MSKDAKILVGSYGHVPPGCSIQDKGISNSDLQAYRAHWNSNNNGNYNLVYKEDNSRCIQGKKPQCEYRNGTVWAMCNGQEFKKYGLDQSEFQLNTAKNN